MMSFKAMRETIYLLVGTVMTKFTEVTMETRSSETITNTELYYLVTTNYLEEQELMPFMVVMVMISYMEEMTLTNSMAKQEKTPFMVTEEMIKSMLVMDGTQSLAVMVVILSQRMTEETLFGSVTVMVVYNRR